MSKKILITGGSGFVGRNVIEELQKSGSDFEIFNLSRTAVELPEVVNVPFDFEIMDFLDLREQFDYIVHTLALSNDRYCTDLTYAEKINIEFTKKLLEFSLGQINLKKFVHISSIIIYDNKNDSPVNESGNLNLNYTNYSFTKGLSEFYAKYYLEKLKLPVVIFRLSNIYGPHQKFKESPFLVPSKIVEALNKREITVFNDQPRRDWIFSRDAARAIALALNSDFCGTMNLGSGQGTSVGELIGEVAKQLQVPFKSQGLSTTGPQDFYCDIGLIKTRLGWEPKTDIKTGIASTIKYIENEIKNS